MNLDMIRSGDKFFVNVDYDQTLTWFEANGIATVNWGGTWSLATILSEAEQASVMSILTGKAWIGLYQEGAGVEEPGGGWAWTTGEWVSEYQHWAPGEPNNAGFEDYGEISLSSFWNDMPGDLSDNDVAVYQVSALTGFKVTGTLGTDNILGGDGADTLFARSGRDTILGGLGDDSINGGLGDNLIEGGAGNDTISSGGGSDRITGGAGVDLLMAGSGVDLFVFEEAADSARGAADSIRYFNDATDRIDFTALSDTLHLSDTAGFHREAGEIVLRQQATRLLVLLDIDGDGQADMALRLGGTHALTDANFLIPVPALE